MGLICWSMFRAAFLFVVLLLGENARGQLSSRQVEVEPSGKAWSPHAGEYRGEQEDYERRRLDTTKNQDSRTGEEEDFERRRLYTTVKVDPSDIAFQFQISTVTWAELKSLDGVKFSPRHGHASCLFTPLNCSAESVGCITPKDSTLQRLWVVGGKVEYYQMYNLLYSYKQNDVWFSDPVPASGATLGQNWKPVSTLTGDFFVQNADAIQPGPVAPFYQRYGHTLTAYDSNNNGQPDMMLLMGGFAPDPVNDIWVTIDGYTWTYHLAPWSPRAWHSTIVNDGILYVMGGTPLNNEVWRLDKISKVSRKHAPLTRSMYMKYTYTSNWTKLGNAEWSPRAGMNVVSQWFFNSNETAANATLRMVLIGGYGGWSQTTDGTKYDGLRCRGDVWTSINGTMWMNPGVENATNGLPPRAWAAAEVLSLVTNPKKDASKKAGPHAAPRIYVVGGSYVGFTTGISAQQLGLQGLTDLQWTRDGITWTRVNYQQGSGTRGYDTFVKFYSSQEWCKSTVDGKNQYLGMWGQTMHLSNNTLILVGGDHTGAGALTSQTWQSQSGLFCDIDGVPCNGAGTCGPLDSNSGCKCNAGPTAGEYCTT